MSLTKLLLTSYGLPVMKQQSLSLSLKEKLLNIASTRVRGTEIVIKEISCALRNNQHEFLPVFVPVPHITTRDLINNNKQQGTIVVK